MLNLSSRVTRKNVILLLTILSSSLASLIVHGHPSEARLFRRSVPPQPSREWSSSTESDPKITGVHIEQEKASIREDGTNVIYADVKTPIRLFGHDFTNSTKIAFTHIPKTDPNSCENAGIGDPVDLDFIDPYMGFITVEVPKTDGRRYICLKHFDSNRSTFWIHQGNDPWLTFEVEGRMLPLGFQIALICMLLCLTALFAGLNLGLMSLDKNELKVIALKGSETEKRYAKSIEPLRSRGNFLLCTILLSNVAINSTLTVLLEDITSGLIAVVISTISITIFGDIVPQAICSRHGLAIGAKTIYIMYLFMFITSPLSWPISKVLDCMLGEEIGQVYDRERLMEFIRVTKDYNKLEQSEVNIISGALELKRKTVGEIMTRLEDVFMLPMTARLDFETVSKIQKSGYSRIPVYKDDRKNIVALFYAKDLAFVDPDDNMPLRTLIEYYKHPLIFTFDDTTLDVALGAFKEGKSHLSFVRHLYDSDTSDPYYEVVGVVTLEDVIEEILQTEIVDETDIITDNRLKQRRKQNPEQDITEFARIGEGQDSTIVSPQMILAAFQYLSSSCPPFRPDQLTPNVLRRLIGQKVYFQHAVDPDREEQEPHYQLYTKDKPVDYFVMILEGRVQVTAGQEQLSFFSGPFSCFGVDALKSLDSNEGTEASFVYKPDFTVEIVQTTTYLQIPRKLYLSAVKASQMERASGIVGTDVGKDLALQIIKEAEKDGKESNEMSTITGNNHVNNNLTEEEKDR